MVSETKTMTNLLDHGVETDPFPTVAAIVAVADGLTDLHLKTETLRRKQTLIGVPIVLHRASQLSQKLRPFEGVALASLRQLTMVKQVRRIPKKNGSLEASSSRGRALTIRREAALARREDEVILALPRRLRVRKAPGGSSGLQEAALLVSSRF